MGMRNVLTISRGWFCDHHCHNCLLFSNAVTNKWRNLILFVLFMPLAVGPGAVRLVNGTLSSGTVQIYMMKSGARSVTNPGISLTLT